MAKRKSLREIAATTPDTQPLEASIVKACLEYLNDLPRACFNKRHGARTRSGDPDIFGCLNGHHWEIEVKRQGQTPTKRQRARLIKWHDAGAVALWVTSVSQLKQFVRSCEAQQIADVRRYAHNML